MRESIWFVWHHLLRREDMNVHISTAPATVKAMLSKTQLASSCPECTALVCRAHKSHASLVLLQPLDDLAPQSINLLSYGLQVRLCAVSVANQAIAGGRSAPPFTQNVTEPSVKTIPQALDNFLEPGPKLPPAWR